jgi:hypothetical protein
MAALLVNFFEVLNVERSKVQASAQKPTEISYDLKLAVLQLVCLTDLLIVASGRCFISPFTFY